MERRPWPTEVGHAILLLGLAGRWPWLVESPDLRTFQQHHITLAYALPIALDAAWRTWAEGHAELLIRGGQLVPVPASELVAVTPADDIHHPRHRRLLRRHSATTVREHQDHSGFLDHWSAFTQWRYDREPPEPERRALDAILAGSGCTIREFIQGQDVIARSVVCKHGPSRTLFDLMASWHPRHARLRPGIFSALHNLTDAARSALRYSLCYGQFPYKADIVGEADHLSLEDLILGKAGPAGDQ